MAAIASSTSALSSTGGAPVRNSKRPKGRRPPLKRELWGAARIKRGLWGRSAEIRRLLLLRRGEGLLSVA
eukprot:5646257-Prymnesium_polylepis.1